jgi:hypothetical protein
MMKKTLLTLLLGTLACGAAMAVGTSASSPTALPSSSAVVRDAAQGTQAIPLAVDDQLARSRPRVPGGSGCDDPEDLIEHPECRPHAASSAVVRDAAQGTQAIPLAVDDQLARSKPRVPGGSGCDDPEDVIEHPECRPQAAPAPGEEQQARETSEGLRG